MRVIIAGAGDVGFHLAKLMSSQSHDITLIDSDKDKLRYAENHLDIIGLRGSASSLKALKEAATNTADMFLAASSIDEINMTACILAKKMGAKFTVARISNPEYETQEQKQFFNELGIDTMIFPEEIAAREIQRLVNKSAFSEYFDFYGKRLSVVAIQVEKDAVLCDKTIEECAHLNAKNNFIPVAILRDEETIIPRKTNHIKARDLVYFIAEPKGISPILQLTGNTNFKIKNVMIIGGGKTGSLAAKFLENNYNVKLVEKDKGKCFELADELSKTLIINGDGRDVEFLEEEDIENMDALVAVTGDAETNIITSIVAKKHHVKKTIALVNNIDYINLSHNIGIDTLINKKLIAADNIFRYVRKGEVSDLVSLPGLDAEMMEFVVQKGARIVNTKIKDVGFPKEAIIGGVIRRNRGYVTMGDFEIHEGDRVVVVTKPSVISQIETLFSNPYHV